MKHLCALAVALALSACASSGSKPDETRSPAKSAQQDDGQQQDSRRASNDDPHRMICTVEKRVGSHMPQRVCASSAQREARRREAEDTLSRLKGGSSPSGLGSGAP